MKNTYWRTYCRCFNFGADRIPRAKRKRTKSKIVQTKLNLTLEPLRSKALLHIENLPLSLVFLDEEGYILDFNAHMVNAFEFDKADYIRKNILEIGNLKLTSKTLMYLFKMLHENKSLAPIEFEVNKNDDTSLWIRIQASLIELEKDHIIQVICQDITTEKEAQDEIARLLEQVQIQNAELKQSEEKYRYLFQTFPSGIILISDDGLILDCNPATVQLFGFEAEELRGKHFKQMSNLNLTKKMLNNLYRILQKNKKFAPIEVQAYHKNGTSIWIKMQGRLNEDGKRSLIQIICQDITSQKDVEAYIVEILDNKEKENEELIELDRIKDEFFADVAHDIRNPLTAIKGISEILLKSDNMSTREIKGLEIIHRNEIALENLINELLNYTKLKEGVIQLKQDRFKISQLIQSLKQDLEMILSKKQIQIIDSYEPDIEVVLDKGQITRIIRNLLDNAIKFSHNESKIIIHSKVQNNKWLFSITDHGIGIKKEDIPAIFKRFSKLKDSKQWNLKGMGLGLTICKGIVEKYTGKIWVDSPGLGKGTTFYIEIPIIN